MRDNQHLMTEFVKIVERFPEIYDHHLDSYRTRFAEIAWAKVAAIIRDELNEECTVDELKVKWKGIRSSFNRYKSKVNLNNHDSNSFKKYYLYDHLRFLDPFVRVKGSSAQEQDKTDTTPSESCNYANADSIEGSNEYSSMEEWNHLEIKPELNNTFDKQRETDTSIPARSNNSETSYCEKSKKRKCSYDDKDTDDDNEDLQFFKSILPDIRNFTIREKRKLKMGILQLIDNLENERKGDAESL